MNGWDGERFCLTSCLPVGNLEIHVSSVKPFYVYVLCRPCGRPFYVGKGVNRRVLDHVAEASNTKRLTHKLNVIRAITRKGGAVRYVIESRFDDETMALARERELIALIGRHDLDTGPLTNQTDGGEGASNPSEASRQRRRETLWGTDSEFEERNIANRWFQEISIVESVPIKPIGRYKIEGLWQNRDHFKDTDRQAAALAASAIANRIMLHPGAPIPRRMKVEGVELIIENGVGRDLLSSQMVVLQADREGYEVLQLTEHGYWAIYRRLDKSILVDAGILEPEADV